MVRDTTPAATRDGQPQRGAPPEPRHRRGPAVQGQSTVWFTGLSGSGKSSVAMLVEQKLLESGRPAYVLDGDNLRHGLNADLGFTMADRAENLRRLAHIATLLADSGQIVLVPAISPLEEHRALARKVHDRPGLRLLRGVLRHPAGGLRAPRSQGAVRQGARGEITHFTGIDSPYQRPKNPDLRLTPDHDVRGTGPAGHRHDRREAVTGGQDERVRHGSRPRRGAGHRGRRTAARGARRTRRRHRRRAKGRRGQARSRLPDGRRWPRSGPTTRCCPRRPPRRSEPTRSG